MPAVRRAGERPDHIEPVRRPCRRGSRCHAREGCGDGRDLAVLPQISVGPGWEITCLTSASRRLCHSWCPPGCEACRRAVARSRESASPHRCRLHRLRRSSRVSQALGGQDPLRGRRCRPGGEPGPADGSQRTVVGFAVRVDTGVGAVRFLTVTNDHDDRVGGHRRRRQGVGPLVRVPQPDSTTDTVNAMTAVTARTRARWLPAAGAPITGLSSPLRRVDKGGGRTHNYSKSASTWQGDHGPRLPR